MGIFQKHGVNIEMDDEMIPVIDELNKLGLRTTSCCSGHPERKDANKHQAQLAFELKDITVIVDENIISINWMRETSK